ncbi:hypothetical protein [Rhodococcus sp. LB1]|uniref:hypothetical protein n=1 Tax=Rhodococcus sp. LB1 TaxID=1807499 RepID=UPI0012E9281E|nr:hypothetical protein [Rhodococcus sp. LB1]
MTTDTQQGWAANAIAVHNFGLPSQALVWRFTQDYPRCRYTGSTTGGFPAGATCSADQQYCHISLKGFEPMIQVQTLPHRVIR